MDSTRIFIKHLKKLGLLNSDPPEGLFRNRPEGVLRSLAMAGLIDEGIALEAIAKYLQVPLIDPDNEVLKNKFNCGKFSKALDTKVLWEHKLVPLWEDDYGIHVATCDPFQHSNIKLLEFQLRKPVKLSLAEERKVVKLLGQHFPITRINFNELNELDDQGLTVIGAKSLDETDISDADTPPIIRLVNKIIADAMFLRASDIHLEPNQFELEVRFRIDGIMHSILNVPKRLQNYVISRFKVLAGMDVAEKRQPQDGRIRIRNQQTTLDLRVSTIPTSFGEKVVLRLLGSDASILTFGQMGLDNLELDLKAILKNRARLFLVTGPTGSGKTTTLYTCLNFLNDGTTNIITIEDPIEYRLAGISQIQLNKEIEVTFASTLRSILRQDPDIIMVGEIRDQETASIAMQAAQTGHQVLSTLHTNDAPSAITRLLDLEIDPYLIADSLSGVLAQRLVRRICDKCKTTISPEAYEANADIAESFSVKPQQIKVGTGCEACNYSGYKGRIGLYSLLKITDEVRNCIHDQAKTEQIVQIAAKDGYYSIEEAAIQKVRVGLTTLQEIRPHMNLLDHKHRKEQVEPKIEIPEPAKKPVTVVAIPQTQSSVPDSPSKVDKNPRKTKLLLVEDDDDIRSVIEMLLMREMYDVSTARNGEEALKIIYDDKPDIVLTDLMMPNMSGKELLARLKGTPELSEIPVLVLTANSSEENEIDLLSLGAKDFVAKTSSSKVLVTRLRRALDS